MSTNPFDQYDEAPAPTITELPQTRSQQRDSARKDREEGYDRGDTAFRQVGDLRKEFMARPSVTEYNVALGTYNSALGTGASSEGDQALITSFARMMDPNSVVREGEFATAAGNERLFAQIRARIAKEFGADQAGRLTPEGRTRLRQEMRNQVVERFKRPYDRDRQYFSRLADSYNYDPFRVVGPSAEEAFDPGLLNDTNGDVVGVETGSSDATTTFEQYPEEGQREHAAMVRRLISENNGTLPLDAYAAERAKLDEKYKPGAQAADPSKWVNDVNTYLRMGGNPETLNLGVAPEERDLGDIEQGINTFVQKPEGAFLANMGNTFGAGLPAALSGSQDNLERIREQNPGSSFAGELVGGTTGALATGGLASGVGGGGRLATLLANPAVTDTAFGGVYGATQDAENPYRGAAVGAGSALVGNKVGQSIGDAFPKLFNRSGINDADASVPTIDELKQLAGEQYKQAEVAGATAFPDDTQQLIESSRGILAQEGRLTPKGTPIDTDTPITRAMKLIGDFEGEAMGPVQAGTVRKVLGEGRSAMRDGAPDNDQRRIAGMLLDNFDQWAEPTLPGVDKARATAQRYIQGEQVAAARGMADAKEQLFTQSGPENALRNAFRALDLNDVRGKANFTPETSQAIQNVSRGTPLGNAARRVGKLAPTGAIPISSSAGLGVLGAVAADPMIGAGVAAGSAGLGTLGRALATSQTKRNAEVAELMARGGPEYEALLRMAELAAKQRAASATAGIFAPVASNRTR